MTVPTVRPCFGFFAIRRKTLRACGALKPIGYKIASEIGVRGKLQPAEIPILFEKRHAGRSKMDTQEIAMMQASQWLDTHRIIVIGLGVAFGVGVNFWLASTWVYRTSLRQLAK